jgi:hypothetical protein
MMNFSTPIQLARGYTQNGTPHTPQARTHPAECPSVFRDQPHDLQMDHRPRGHRKPLAVAKSLLTQRTPNKSALEAVGHIFLTTITTNELHHTAN